MAPGVEPGKTCSMPTKGNHRDQKQKIGWVESNFASRSTFKESKHSTQKKPSHITWPIGPGVSNSKDRKKKCWKRSGTSCGGWLDLAVKKILSKLLGCLFGRSNNSVAVAEGIIR